MKKILSLILAFCLLLTCAACGRNKGVAQESGVEVEFFYETKNSEQMENLSDNMAVVSEIRTYDAFSLQELLSIYLRGPVSDQLASPFPRGTAVLDVYTEDGKMILKMSGEYFTLMGIDLSLANYCLGSTVCAYTNLDSIAVVDEMDTIYLDIYPEQYVVSYDMSEATDESFTVYFADHERRYLLTETRAAILSDNETDMAYVMRNLMEGPESTQAYQIIPDGTELLDITCSDGRCSVNFSPEFVENRYDDTYGAYTTLYGITNTLTGLSEVVEVEFLVEGEPLTQYGIFSLEKPLTRNLSSVGPVRASGGEIGVNVYLLGEDGKTVFSVPGKVKQSVSKPLAEAVAAAVVGFEPFAGFDNPIPYGTELRNVSVSGNICYVDVSERFVPQEDTLESEQAAIWALVKALTDLDNITYVVLTVEGESSGFNYVDISEPLSSVSISLH